MVKTNGDPLAWKKLCDLIKEVDGTTEDLTGNCKVLMTTSRPR